MKSKAYCFANAADYDIDDLSEQVWADKYGDVDSIPVEEWLNHGWYFICDTCGAKIEDVADFHVNSAGYCCKKCFNEWVESGRENRNKL